MPVPHKACLRAEVPEGAGKEVIVEGRPIAVFQDAAGKFHALDNACLHRGGPLSEGTLEGTVVTCPWHHWRFDVATGCHAADPRSRVRTYPVKVEGDSLILEL